MATVVQVLTGDPPKVLGEITMQGGKVTSTVDGMRQKIERLRARGATEQRMLDAFAAGWSNGYIWTEAKAATRSLRYSEDQPRDELGRWGSGGGAATGVSGVEAKLRDGKAATVDPSQMHALMTELGSRPPSVNLAQLRVTGKGNENLYTANKEIPRAQMPQLPGTPERLGEFSAKLAENGLTAEMKTVDPRDLHMTQNQLDSQKVAGLYDKLLNAGWSAKTVLITDKDGNILDGHHRWAAAAAANASGKADFRVNTFRVNTDIDTLLSVAHEVSLPAREFARSITFGDKPPMPPPSDDEPWLWADGQWWLVVTDTADDVPSMLRIEGRSLRFSEDQPRDDHGRWTSGGGGEGTTKEKPTPLTDAEFAAHISEVEAKTSAALKAGQSTDKTMTVNGAGEVYDAERSAQQQEIINELYDQMAATAGEDGKAIVMGGLGGAGKSTVLANNLGVDRSDYVTINPDDIKEAMAARGMVPDIGLSPMESASLVHEESSAMANRMAARAMADHKNIIYDITMSSEGSVQKRLDRLAAAGYTNVHGVFVDIPVEKSVDSAISRYRSGMEAYRAGEGSGGRYVPPTVIRQSADPTGEYNSANRAHFEALKPQFDSWSLYDRSGTGPAQLVGRTGTP
jgi:predicted ABC-type ATPase